MPQDPTTRPFSLFGQPPDLTPAVEALHNAYLAAQEQGALQIDPTLRNSRPLFLLQPGRLIPEPDASTPTSPAWGNVLNALPLGHNYALQGAAQGQPVDPFAGMNSLQALRAAGRSILDILLPATDLNQDTQYGTMVPMPFRGQRVFHGTKRKPFQHFDPSQYGSGAGGDLMGPGIYLTDNPKVAAGYGQRDMNTAYPSVQQVEQVFQQLTDAIKDRPHAAEWTPLIKEELKDILGIAQTNRYQPLSLRAIRDVLEERLWRDSSVSSLRSHEYDSLRNFFDAKLKELFPESGIRKQRLPSYARVLDADAVSPQEVQQLQAVVEKQLGVSLPALSDLKPSTAWRPDPNVSLKELVNNWRAVLKGQKENEVRQLRQEFKVELAKHGVRGYVDRSVESLPKALQANAIAIPDLLNPNVFLLESPNQILANRLKAINAPPEIYTAVQPAFLKYTNAVAQRTPTTNELWKILHSSGQYDAIRYKAGKGGLGIGDPDLGYNYVVVNPTIINAPRKPFQDAMQFAEGITRSKP